MIISSSYPKKGKKVIDVVTCRFAHNYLLVSFCFPFLYKNKLLSIKVSFSPANTSRIILPYLLYFFLEKDISYNHIRVILSGSTPYNLHFHPPNLFFQRRLDSINYICNISSKSISRTEIKRINQRYQQHFC